MFTFYDWGIVVIYIIAMLWLGLKLAKKQTTTKSYFLGDKSIPWWAAGISVVATEASALTVIGIPAMAYTGNIKYLQIVLGLIIARIIVSFFIIPKYFAGKTLYSPYELISQKFGNSARTVSVIFFMISGLLGAGVRVYVTAIPLKLILGIDITTCILIFGSIAIVYTYFGGITAVIWTDVTQFFMFLFAGIFALFYIPTLMNGGLTEIINQASSADKLAFYDSTLALGGDYNIWMGLIGATFLCIMSHGVDQLTVQRILSCKNKKEGQKAMLLSGVLVLPLALIFLCVGIMLWAYYQTHPFAIPPYDVVGKFKADWTFPIFVISQMPIFVKGIIVASIFAAAMSSVDSALSAISSVYVMNVHKEYFAKGKDEKYYIKLSKISVLVFGIILMAVAFLCQNVPLIFNAAFKLAGITSGAVLGGVLFAIFSKKSKYQAPVIAGMIASVFVMIIISALGQQKQLDIGWAWYGVIGTSTMLIVAYIFRLVIQVQTISEKLNNKD